MRIFILLCLFAVSAKSQAPVASERRPGTIQRLPPEIRQDLARRECFVPKYSGNGSSTDTAYTMGHLQSSVTVDYAVVCHIPNQKLQHVLVYSNSQGVWRSEVIDRGPFDPSPHGNRCEEQVSLANPTEIRSYAHAFAPEELKHLPKLDHDGVEINLCDKASTIHYFSHGRWLQFQGAD